MITFEHVFKSYDDKAVVIDDVSLDVIDGEILVLLGYSGSGKTTLLKMVNKLLPMSSGDIRIDGKSINQVGDIELRRSIGYVIQQVGLFPHMTVKENIEIIGKIQKRPLEEIEQNTERVVEMIGLNLEEFLYRYPAQLSGGQQQRIGVARALSTNPQILLMDEPFSALDPITRSQLQDELLKIQEQLKRTILFVTHSIDEAIKMADRICILNEGKIEQLGTPKELLKNPATEYVSNFVGKGKLWRTPTLLTVEDIMTTKLTIHMSNISLEKAWQQLLSDNIPMIFVVDEAGKMIGKVTEKMLMRYQEEQGLAGELGHAMKTDYEYVHPDTCLQDALEIMQDSYILYLPVLDEFGKPIGLVHIRDIMNLLSRQFEDDKVDG